MQIVFKQWCNIISDNLQDDVNYYMPTLIKNEIKKTALGDFPKSCFFNQYYW